MSATREAAYRFSDGQAYERFIGVWSREATPRFLDWLGAPRDAHWLDVGCGTGILTEEILRSASPRFVDAVDSAQEQVDLAAGRLCGRPVRFHVANAVALPFPGRSFDVVASALVVNFLRDKAAGLREMHRVARPGAAVAAFVWDFAAERSPSWPMRQALRAIGVAVPPLPGTSESTAPALRALFEHAGFEEIATTTFEVSVPFRNLDDFWDAQTPGYSPSTRLIDALSDEDRNRLRRGLDALLPRDGEGRLAYTARANAIKARA